MITGADATATMGTLNAILGRVAGRSKKLVLDAPPKSRAPGTPDDTESSMSLGGVFFWLAPGELPVEAQFTKFQ
jgi:hypothetical protein